jgi:hypothetical protein
MRKLGLIPAFAFLALGYATYGQVKQGTVTDGANDPTKKNGSALEQLMQKSHQPNPPGRYVLTGECYGQYGQLELLISHSDLIIDGIVDEVLPSVRVSDREPLSLETYSRISVKSVIRGKLPADQRNIAIREDGGSSEGYEVVFKEHPVVEQGRRYILFLRPCQPPFCVAPDLGMPLYEIAGCLAGRVQVTDKGTVQFLPDAYKDLKSFNGLTADEFLTKLTDRIGQMYHEPVQSSKPLSIPPGVTLPFRP